MKACVVHSNDSLGMTLDIGAGGGGCQGGRCSSADGLGGRLRLRGGICAALHLQSPVHIHTRTRRTALQERQVTPVLALLQASC